jgi:Cu(I)/Ag(I) efflux system membrane protein CusA/SilA
MTVCAVLASLVPILWESGIGSDVMKPIAAPIVGGMITSTIHVLILVPVFFVMMKERALQKGTSTRRTKSPIKLRSFSQHFKDNSNAT